MNNQSKDNYIELLVIDSCFERARKILKAAGLYDRLGIANRMAEAIELYRLMDKDNSEDTSRLEWLANNGGGFTCDVEDRGISTRLWGKWASGPLTLKDFRLAIDRAKNESEMKNKLEKVFKK